MTKQPALKEARADVVSVLKEARALLVKRGWCQRQSQDESGAHCALGAIWKVGPRDGVPQEQALIRAINHKEGTTYTTWHSVAKWNDAPGRTKKEVLALFTSAIRSETARKG